MLGLGHRTGPGWAPLGQGAINTSCPGSVLLPRAGGQRQLCQSLPAVTWAGDSPTCAGHSQPLPRRQEGARGRGSGGSTGPESPAPGWCRCSCRGPSWWPVASESACGPPGRHPPAPSSLSFWILWGSDLLQCWPQRTSEPQLVCVGWDVDLGTLRAGQLSALFQRGL